MVTKTIDRAYILTVDEVKQALWDFLKMKLDQPVPDKPEQIEFTWNVPGEAFVKFSESQVLRTGK
jgi:hypothetical protein